MGRVLTDEQRCRQNVAKQRYYAKKMVDPVYREAEKIRSRVSNLNNLVKVRLNGDKN